jgi:hypothetical protein
MALISVIDAQIKCKNSAQDEAKKLRWWKKSK